MLKSFVACSSRRSLRIIDGFPLSECNPVRKTEASSQEDSMSFPLDDDSSGAEGSPSFLSPWLEITCLTKCWPK